MMILKVLSFSADYIITKYAMQRSQYLNPFDLCLGVVVILCPMNLYVAKNQKVPLNIFKYKSDLFWVIWIRAFIGTINNLWMLYALKFISVGKSILVRSLNPLWCSIIAAIILKETLTKVTVTSTVISIVGIYLLTLNSVEESADSKYTYIGYSLASLSAWLYGGIFVCIRYLNINGAHPIMSSFWVGVGILLQTILAFFWGYLNYDKYDKFDIAWLVGVGLVNFTGQLWMSLANKYSPVSKMSPFNNLEIIVTLLADAVIFHYVSKECSIVQSLL